MIWTSKQLETALSIKINHHFTCGQLQFNSLDIKEGDIFIALKGVRDGHEFVQDAINRGACVAIVSQKIDSVDPNKLLLVEDSFDAMLNMAKYKRDNLNAKFIAVTGSVGKTTTKDALGTMLSAYGKTFVSRGTFNNHLGVPLNLASIPNDVQYVVLEMGMNSKNEIKFLSNLVAPDLAVITTISETHIGFFDSLEDIAEAKCEIFHGLDPKEGIAIINTDMKLYERCTNNINKARIHNVQTFGRAAEAGAQLISNKLLMDGSLATSYKINDKIIELTFGNIPPHFAENFAACFAVVQALGLDLSPACDAIRSFKAALGRGSLVSRKQGSKEYQIICDYYNCSPQSLVASLDYLANFDHNNKVAILGDMRELGKFSTELHKKMVSHIKNAKIKKLFLVGEEMKKIKDDFVQEILVKHFQDSNSLASVINDYLKGTELILIKGSRDVKLEEVAQAIGVNHAF